MLQFGEGENQMLELKKEKGLQFAEYKGFSVRMIMVQSEPWFVACDICRAIGIANVSQTLARLDSDQKGHCQIDTLGGPQKTSIVNEPGLYEIIFRSEKEEARAFRRWVTFSILPNLRKHGRFDKALSQYNPQEIQLIEADPEVASIKHLFELKQEQVVQRHRLEVVEAKQKKLRQSVIEVDNKVDNLESKFLSRTGCQTALGFSIDHGFKIPERILGAIGKKITAHMRDRGMEPEKHTHEKWGSAELGKGVNVYPIDILEKHHNLFKEAHESFNSTVKFAK